MAPQLVTDGIVPGTFTRNDFGFLGTVFAPIGSGYVNSYYMPHSLGISIREPIRVVKHWMDQNE